MSKKNILPEGTRDIIFDECVIKRNIERNVDELFEKWGYKEVITPTVEYYETFNQDFQILKEEDMYKFFDNKGRILVLRPDMTIPIGRVVETKLKDSAFPLQLRYNSNIFRVHESFGGKRNEYTDMGVELIGLEDTKSDLEMLVLALESLKTLGLNEFKLEIGYSGFFNAALKGSNIDEECKNAIATFIDEKNLKSLEEYLDSLDIQDGYKTFFNRLPWMFGEKEILQEARELAFNSELKESISYLEKLYFELEELGYSGNITFDLGMVPRLDYYTGIIFKGYCEGVGTTVLRGGRYDNLIKPYKKSIPAIGFSIDINCVISILDINSNIKNRKEIYKIYYNEKNKIEAIKKSIELRNSGFIAELCLNDDSHSVKVVKEGEL